MTEYEYLRRRIRDCIENSCDSSLSEKQRQNQREALRFHLAQMQSAKLLSSINQNKS
ncbi:MAG: hypothetical protein IKT68_05065 [Clostridia bacterium]|nr:hypothetical protein [Clostridia bacterium]